MPTTKIASFDPASYRNLGWAYMGVVESNNSIDELKTIAGTFVMPKVDQPWQMLWPLFTVVEQFFTKQKPELVIIEKTSSFAGGFVTGQVSNCIGVILACCGKFSIPVTFVYPSHVKKVITGKGKATKTQLKKAVALHLSQLGSVPEKDVKFDSEHAYDAVANILCFLVDEGYLEIGDYDG